MLWSIRREKLINWYLGVGVAIIPLISGGNYLSPYEVPKGIYFACYAISFYLLTIVAKIKWRSGDQFIAKSIYLLMLLTVASSIVNQNFGLSYWGNSYRFDGLISLESMLGLSIIVMHVWRQGWERVVFPALFISSLMVTILKIELGNINLLAGYLSVSIPFGYYLAESSLGWKKVIWKILLGWQIFSIIMTGSWGGIMAVGIFLAMMALRDKPKKTIVLASALIIMLFWGIYQIDYANSISLGSIVAESRTRILGKGLIAITKKPLLGWGWAQFSRVFAEIDYPVHYLVDAYVDRAHSSLIEMGVAIGIPGLSIFIFLVTRVCLALSKSGKLASYTILMVIVIYMIHSQTNVTSITEEVIFWLSLGIAGSKRISS